MQKDYRFLFIVGFIIFILPIIGIPESWKVIVQYIIGFILMLAAIMYRAQRSYLTEQKEESVELAAAEKETDKDSTQSHEGDS